MVGAAVVLERVGALGRAGLGQHERRGLGDHAAPGRGAALVVERAQRPAGGGRVERRAQKVVAARAVDPARAEDQVRDADAAHAGLPRQPALAVDARRPRRIPLVVGGLFHPVEDAARGEVHQAAAEALDLVGDDRGRRAVDRHGQIALLLGAVEVGVGGGVDDDRRPQLADHAADRAGVLQRQLGRVDGRDGAQRRERAAQLPAELPVLPGDEDHAGRSVASASSGSARSLAESRLLPGRPLDADRRVVPAHAAVAGGPVDVGAEVGDVGALADHAVAVREPGGDEELAVVLLREERADPAAEGRRAAPDVHRDVEDLAADREDELGLRAHRAGSAGRAARRAGSARGWPGRSRRDPRVAVAGGVPGLQEKAALVAEDARLEQQHPGQGGLRRPSSLLLQQPQQVAAVVVLRQLLGEGAQLRVVDEAHAPGDLLDRRHLEPLALLDGAHEVRGVQQRGVRAGVQPGDAAAEHLDPQRAGLLVGAVDVHDLQLAARRGAQPRGDVGHPPVVEVQPGDRQVRARARGLLLDREHARRRGRSR